MKILTLSESDKSGGAAIAAYRLHLGLAASNKGGVMLTQTKIGVDNSVVGPSGNMERSIIKARMALNHLPKALYPLGAKSQFHLQWLPGCSANAINRYAPDLLHLHWICRGFVDLRLLSKITIPVVWTLHDCWPFTGGCHYPDRCMEYARLCGRCPQLGSPYKKDISRWTLRRKTKLWANTNLTVVAPSFWIKSRAKESTLFRERKVEVIPYGIDLRQFSPRDAKFARAHLNLPPKKKLVLFGAVDATSDERKGFKFLFSALSNFISTAAGKNTELVVFGSSGDDSVDELGIKTTFMGKLFDEVSISLVMSACDIFVLPSLQDNLPNTIIEAMACGLPCAVFKVGGVPEMVDHKKNGYIAKPRNSESLACGIQWILEDENRWQRLSIAARAKAEAEYDINKIIQIHKDLYSGLIDQAPSRK